MKKAEPKCPDCGVTGIEKIVSEESDARSKGGDAWFEVASCYDCGHVYGVFPKVVHSPTMQLPTLGNVPGY